MALAVLAGFAALVATAPAANSSGVDCRSYDLVVWGDPDGDGDGTFYMAIDEVAGEKYLYSVWYYAESNGEPSLQRGGTTELGDDDICQTSANPDHGIM